MMEHHDALGYQESKKKCVGSYIAGICRNLQESDAGPMTGVFWASQLVAIDLPATIQVELVETSLDGIYLRKRCQNTPLFHYQ